MNIIKKIIVYTYIIVVLAFILLMFLDLNKNRYKKYIINHSLEIVKTKDYSYRISKCDWKYYTDITIYLYPDGDSSYTVTFWGDRDSWQWNIRSDKQFHVPGIPYKRHKGKNVKLDVELIKQLK